MSSISRYAVIISFGFLAVLSDPVAAHLLVARRSSGVLRPEYDLPVFNFLRDGKAHSHVSAWALKGTPTHYTLSGCKKVNKVYNKISNTGGLMSMSVSRCFAFCSKRKGVSYFGISNGNDCWCAQAVDASPLGSASCDKPCPGYPADMCGGIEGTSLYSMYDCTNATKEEIEAEEKEKKEALLSSYGSLNGETCGQAENNILQLDGKGYLSGSVDTCKLACWQAPGAQECHGFTYDALMSKCTFHYDVSAGTVTENDKASCYFKIP